MKKILLLLSMSMFCLSCQLKAPAQKENQADNSDNLRAPATQPILAETICASSPLWPGIPHPFDRMLKVRKFSNKWALVNVTGFKVNCSAKIDGSINAYGENEQAKKSTPYQTQSCEDSDITAISVKGPYLYLISDGSLETKVTRYICKGN